MTAKRKGRTAADFKSTHDPETVYRAKLAAALARMAKEHGPEHYEYEKDFCTFAGISTNAVVNYREYFAAHIVEAPGIGRNASSVTKLAWFATPQGAKASGGKRYDTSNR